ncbi:hypothetical protein AACB27_38420, partial [Burkholderia contaminans]
IDYMGAALKGVPEFKPTVPDGVESLGGELYFTEFAPGHGFVSTVGVPQAPAAQNVDATVPHVDEQEKQDIMNLFAH